MDTDYQIYRKERLEGKSHDQSSGWVNMFLAKEYAERFDFDREAQSQLRENHRRGPYNDWND